MRLKRGNPTSLVVCGIESSAELPGMKRHRFIVSLNNIIFSNNFVYILKSHVKIKLVSLSLTVRRSRKEYNRRRSYGESQ